MKNISDRQQKASWLRQYAAAVKGRNIGKIIQLNEAESSQWDFSGNINYEWLKIVADSILYN